MRVFLEIHLPHEQKGADAVAQGPARQYATVRLVADGLRVGAVGHGNDRPPVAVLAQNVRGFVIDGPHLVAGVVERHHVFQRPQRQAAGMGDAVKILVILAVKGRDQRNPAPARDAARRASGQKGGMGMDHVKGHAARGAAKIPAQRRDAHPVGFARNGHAGIEQRFQAGNRRGGGIAGGDIQAPVPHAGQRLAIGQHHPAHAVQRRGIGFAELADDHRGLLKSQGISRKKGGTPAL